MICERNTQNGFIGFPSCCNGKQETKVIIEYNELDKDILYLCEDCAELIKKDAMGHNYKVTIIKIRGNK